MHVTCDQAVSKVERMCLSEEALLAPELQKARKEKEMSEPLPQIGLPVPLYQSNTCFWSVCNSIWLRRLSKYGCVNNGSSITYISSLLPVCFWRTWNISDKPSRHTERIRKYAYRLSVFHEDWGSLSWAQGIALTGFGGAQSFIWHKVYQLQASSLTCGWDGKLSWALHRQQGVAGWQTGNQ
jgi:hypothetical protein